MLIERNYAIQGLVWLGISLSCRVEQSRGAYGFREWKVGWYRGEIFEMSHWLPECKQTGMEGVGPALKGPSGRAEVRTCTKNLGRRHGGKWADLGWWRKPHVWLVTRGL